MAEQGDQALLNQPLELDEAAATQTLRSFVIMSVCFAMNLGCVTTVIAYASSNFQEIGNYSNGTLFGAYCLCALFFGNVIVTALGFKKALICGMAQYCIYLTMYMVAALVGSTPFTKGLVLLGAVVGGTASGYLWTAQGAYFSKSAERYAAFKGISKEAATGKFSSYFAMIFLFFEVVLKIVAAGIQSGFGATGIKVLYVLLLGIGFLSLLGMTRIDNISKEPQKVSMDMVVEKSSAAFRLLIRKPEMILMVPTQLTFGFASTFINSYISPKVTKPLIGGGAIGYFAGTIAGVACIISALGGLWIRRTGSKWPLMVLGSASFVCMAGGFLFYETEMVDGTATYPSINISLLIMIYALMGVGRGVFESTNKAVIADFFTKEETMAAFANVIWSSGGSSALGFFLFPNLAATTQVWITLITGFTGIVCFFIALAINRSRPKVSSYNDLDA